MNKIFEAIFTALSSVWLAYSIGYIITLYLPSSGLFSLGIFASPDALNSFNHELNVPQNYFDAVSRLWTWDFGLTQDKRVVVAEIKMSLADTLPVFIVSIFFQIGILYIALFFLPEKMGLPLTFLKFLAFIPAYLPPLIGFLVVISLDAGSVLYGEWTKTITVFIVSVIPVSAFLILMVHAILIQICEQNYYKVPKAYGFSEKDQRRKIFRNLIFALLPGFHKIISLQFAVLMFTESIFSNAGFGSQLFFSFQRTDVNMILSSIFIMSIFIAFARLVTFLIEILMFGKTGLIYE